MNNIFINADDFGLNTSVNNAIVELFDKRLINSTTLMANMPAFEHAVELAHLHGFTDKIGVHLVLTEGMPLTPEIGHLSFLFNGKGRFRKSWLNILFLKKSHKRLIYKELAAQIEKIQSKNIYISHMDSHHHVHEVYSITKILLELKTQYNIKYIRILNNLGKSSKLSKRVYRHLINIYLKQKKANYSDFFGNKTEFLARLNKESGFFKNKKVEIMVHPNYDFEGNLIDSVDREEYNLNFLKILKTRVI